MKKRQRKKMAKRITQWIAIEYSSGEINTIGVNCFGFVPKEGRPYVGGYKNMYEVLDSFTGRGAIPYVKLEKEEEYMIFDEMHDDGNGRIHFGSREKFGFWGEKYIIDKIKNGEFLRFYK